MEQWKDRGIILAARPHGEGGAIVSVLTEYHGRHAGYVRGAFSRRMRGILQPGNLVDLQWSARISDSLGSYSIEQERNLAAPYLADPLRLRAIQSACALCDSALPEREGHPGLFYGLQLMFDAMADDIWGAAYVVWELAFLKELGFGLNLTRCAGGGDPADLAYVSPRSGHAVSNEAAAPYKDRLLPLPAFLSPQKGNADETEILKGLRLCGYFLRHWVYVHHSKGIPPERARFEESYARMAADDSAVDENAVMSA